MRGAATVCDAAPQQERPLLPRGVGPRMALGTWNRHTLGYGEAALVVGAAFGSGAVAVPEVARWPPTAAALAFCALTLANVLLAGAYGAVASRDGARRLDDGAADLCHRLRRTAAARSQCRRHRQRDRGHRPAARGMAGSSRHRRTAWCAPRHRCSRCKPRRSHTSRWAGPSGRSSGRGRASRLRSPSGRTAWCSVPCSKSRYRCSRDGRSPAPGPASSSPVVRAI